jgi:hypothetical protein
MNYQFIGDIERKQFMTFTDFFITLFFSDVIKLATSVIYCTMDAAVKVAKNNFNSAEIDS